MEALLLLFPAVLLAGAILIAPRPALRPLALIVIGLVAVGTLWAWSFANRCSSDGCIGIWIIAGPTFATALLCGVAGAIRWGINRYRDRHRQGGDRSQ